MLLRAGIGPVGHLRDLGIEVRAQLPGVGQRLMDHPSISVASFLKAGARKNPHSQRSLHLGMRFSSGIEGAPPWRHGADRVEQIRLACDRRSDRGDHSLGEQDFSETGQVRLASADWRQEPDVDFNLLSDHRDLQRLARGFRRSPHCMSCHR